MNEIFDLHGSNLIPLDSILYVSTASRRNPFDAVFFSPEYDRIGLDLQ